MFLTPNIGAIGVFHLFAPFKNKLLPKTLYQCIAIRKLEDYVCNNEDAFALIYEPLLISKERYQDDLAAGAMVVTLKAIGTHEFVLVPNSYIEKLPVTEGVSYTVMGLGVSLGAIPNDTDLTYLKDRITTLVAETLGVNSTINALALSPTSVVDMTTHKSILLARELLIKENPTDRAKYLETKAKLDELQVRYNELEQYVIDNASK